MPSIFEIFHAPTRLKHFINQVSVLGPNHSIKSCLNKSSLLQDHGVFTFTEWLRDDARFTCDAS